MQDAFLIMVVTSFTAFVVVLGVFWARNYLDDARAAKSNTGH